MVKYVIVEDEEIYQNKCKTIIDKIMFNNDKVYETVVCEEYNNELRKIIKDNSIPKIFIMDIELKGKKSGLDIAREIREEDWDSEIIFITNHDKMFEPVYRSIFKVFDFIEKFHDMDNRLKKDIKAIISQNYDTKKFLYASKRADLQIFLKDIIYIYRDTTERKIVIVTTSNKFYAGLSITEALAKCDERFKQVHRACIVNSSYVQSYNWNEGYFILKTGEQINLCSKNYKE